MTKRVHISQPHDVYCGRPSIYGNPWSYKDGTLAKFKVATKGESIENFKKYLETNREFQTEVEKLRGKTLACWCRNNNCHVQVMVDWLNKDTKLDELFGI
jgi:hypothetical protein